MDDVWYGGVRLGVVYFCGYVVLWCVLGDGVVYGWCIVVWCGVELFYFGECFCGYCVDCYVCYCVGLVYDFVFVGGDVLLFVGRRSVCV